MGYTAQQAKDFINHIAPMIKKEGNARGYSVVSTTIAQAIIEGACGTSSLAKVYHNHFGMKAGSAWKGKVVNLKTKEEYTKGTLTTIRDGFRVYDSDEDGVKGYYDFISSKRYANLRNAKDYRQFADYLKKDGYATSSTYVNTLCKTVEKYDLSKYDSNSIQVAVYPNTTIRKGSKQTEEVELLQELLNIHGYQLKVDGIFGDKTDEAVRKFQASKALTIDGIVGPKTWEKLKKE